MSQSSPCPSCSADQMPGARWCTHCRTNLFSLPVRCRLASPIKRLGAYWIDLTIPLVFLLVILTGAGAVTAFVGDTIGGLVAFLILGAYVAVALKLFVRGTTPGKYVLKMRVIRDTGADPGFLIMLLREWVGKYVAGLFFGLGYVWILIDQDNQGWHDKLMSTFVVELEH